MFSYLIKHRHSSKDVNSRRFVLVPCRLESGLSLTYLEESVGLLID